MRQWPKTVTLAAPHCMLKNEYKKLSMIQHQEHFENINILYVQEWHGKMVVSDKEAIIGGRNLSSSGWKDYSFSTSDPEVIEELVNEFWIQWGALKGNHFKEKIYMRDEVKGNISNLLLELKK